MKKNNNLIFLILFLGFILRIWNINWGLPYLYNTDEYRVVNFTLKMAATKNLNPGSFVYPTFYLYIMLFIYSLLFGIGKILGVYKDPLDFGIKFLQDPSLVYIISRAMSAIFGTFLIWVCYMLGKKMYNEKVGVISGFIITVLPSFVEYSHYAKLDMFYTFLVVVFGLFLYLFVKTNNLKYYYLSCIFLGLAISTKYLPAIFGLMILYVVYYKKLSFKHLILGFFVIIISFLFGTPYAVIDYRNFLKDVLFGHTIGAGISRRIIDNFILTLKNYTFLGCKLPVIGVLGIISIFSTIKLGFSFNEIYLLIPIVLLFLVNTFHYHTQWYFLMSSFPFLFILVAYFIYKNSLKSKIYKKIFLILFLVMIVETIFLVISFGIKDTRTQAKEWVETHIPKGSKILIDMYTYSPQLKMTKYQLEKLYKKAIELNHYKKDYIYYQLLAYREEEITYEIFQVWRPFYEVSTIKHEVEEAQKLQPIVDVSKGVSYVKSLGIQYVIINSYNYNGYPLEFYKEVEHKGELLCVFRPTNFLQPGPIIKIYKI
ncbi:MAG: glycosyltransferase family 39 protein [Endomicrobia bacterium]|nr:glycosyltransferase family 39 protein [Endomicrobiia bacterium]